MSQTISSIEGLMRRLTKLSPAADETVFYRGHSNRTQFKLSPSLHRNIGHQASEQLLVNELLSSNPADFREDQSMFERLVRMQHHSLPTRLLDVTSNPLMALFFACCEDPLHAGEIVIIKAKRDKIKFSDSDTVSCIANLSRLTSSERSGINITLPLADFNASPPIARLLSFIKEEKPYFTSSINPAHLGSIVCVKPRLSNQRILSQSGAFLLFGLSANLPESGNGEYSIERATINKKKKSKICAELETLNIHSGTVYPNIDSSSKVIKARYQK